MAFHFGSTTRRCRRKPNFVLRPAFRYQIKFKMKIDKNPRWCVVCVLCMCVWARASYFDTFNNPIQFTSHYEFIRHRHHHQLIRSAAAVANNKKDSMEFWGVCRLSLSYAVNSSDGCGNGSGLAVTASCVNANITDYGVTENCLRKCAKKTTHTENMRATSAVAQELEAQARLICSIKLMAFALFYAYKYWFTSQTLHLHFVWHERKHRLGPHKINDAPLRCDLFAKISRQSYVEPNRAQPTGMVRHYVNWRCVV